MATRPSTNYTVCFVDAMVFKSSILCHTIVGVKRDEWPIMQRHQNLLLAFAFFLWILTSNVSRHRSSSTKKKPKLVISSNKLLTQHLILNQKTKQQKKNQILVPFYLISARAAAVVGAASERPVSSLRGHVEFRVHRVFTASWEKAARTFSAGRSASLKGREGVFVQNNGRTTSWSRRHLHKQ